jgi:hypothetical protein
MHPSQMDNSITTYSDENIFSDSSLQFDLTSLKLKPNYLYKKGNCSSQFINAQLEIESTSGLFFENCTKGRNGKYRTESLPLKVFAHTRAATSMDLKPELDAIGTSAAFSVGIAASQHGQASEVRLAFDYPTQSATATITYQAVARAPNKAKAVTELVIEYRDGVPTVLVNGDKTPI